jgi:hypothetical protein
MDERLERLEARCDEIEKSLAVLAARLDAVALGEQGTAPPAVPGPPSEQPLPELDATPLFGSLTDVGRSLLVLGGAFLIRALTESGAVPRGAGIALGLAYAIGWIALADRVGGRGKRLAATLFGATAVLIASPLAVEAATRLDALPASVSTALIAGFAALAFLVAVRRNLQALAWVACLAAIAALAALFSAPSAAAPAALGLLAVGVLTNRLADGPRAWVGPRWPAAIAADLAVVLLAWLAARREGPPEPYAGLSAGATVAIALALPFAYVAAAALRTLRSGQHVSPFDVSQSVASLAIGLGSAAAAAGGAPVTASAIGLVGLLLSAACYAVAARIAVPRNVRFYAYLGLGLALYAGRLVFEGGPLGLFWAALGLAAALLTTRRPGRTLAIHSAVYLAAAAAASGLAAAPFAAFLDPAPPALPLSLWAAAALGASVGSYVALAAAGGSLAPRLVAAGLSLAGAGTLAVWLVVRFTTNGHDAGWIAASRTGVLALSAVVLAGLWRARGLRELRWLAWTALAVGALQILLQDVPQGHAASLVAALVLYGLALMAAPRWLKSR